MFYGKRIKYIGNVKMCSLFLIILWHCSLFFEDNPFFPESSGIISDSVTFVGNIQNVTVVAAFVFCSGFLFALSLEKSQRSVGGCILERTKRLLIPYYVVGIIWLVPLYTLMNINTFGRPENAGLLEGYKCMLLGQFSDHLWFLWMLFWVAVFFALLSPLIKKRKMLILFVITIVGAFSVDLFLADFPYFKLSQIAPYLVCFYFGILFFVHREKLEALSQGVLWILTASAFAILIAYDILLPQLPSHFTVFYVMRPVGAMFMFFLFLALSKVSGWSRIENSKTVEKLKYVQLEIYLLHEPFPYFYSRLLQPYLAKTPWLCIFATYVLTLLSVLVLVNIFAILRERLWRRSTEQS